MTVVAAETCRGVVPIQGIARSFDEEGTIATTIASAVQQQGAATTKNAPNVQQTAQGDNAGLSNASLNRHLAMPRSVFARALRLCPPKCRRTPAAFRTALRSTATLGVAAGSRHACGRYVRKGP
jgi:hypothetical protein